MSETLCHKTLHVEDDKSENVATFTCGLPVNHKGLHCEQYRPNDGYAVMLWEKSSQDVQRAATEQSKKGKQ